MAKQVLTEDERKSIRSRIYNVESKETTDYNDQKIAFFIKHSSGSKVLDLGSVDHYEDNWKSRFWLFKALANNVNDIVGLDYYERGVKSLQAEGFNIVYGDAQDFSFEEKFDVVTAGDLIEHLPNLEGFITSIRSVLTTKGKLVISTPNPWCWKYVSYHVVRGKLARINPEHVSWFCLQTIENVFSRFDFEIADYCYSSRRSYEKMVPLPARIKHTTLNVALTKL